MDMTDSIIHTSLLQCTINCDIISSTVQVLGMKLHLIRNQPAYKHNTWLEVTNNETHTSLLHYIINYIIIISFIVWVLSTKLHMGRSQSCLQLNYGNCDIGVKQEISVTNETKQDESLLKLKV